MRYFRIFVNIFVLILLAAFITADLGTVLKFVVYGTK